MVRELFLYPSGYPEVLHLESEEEEYTLIQPIYCDGWTQ